MALPLYAQLEVADKLEAEETVPITEAAAMETEMGKEQQLLIQ